MCHSLKLKDALQKIFLKTFVSPMMGCLRFSDPRIVGAVADRSKLFYCLRLPFKLILGEHCGFSVKDHGSISKIFHCHQSDFLRFLDQI